MDIQNSLSAANSLIEALADEQLAACMGGSLNINPAGKPINYVVGPDGQYQGTSYAPGQLSNPGKGKNGISYIGDPTTSTHYASGTTGI